MLHMTDMRAAVAQSVERRLGKAEVGGSIPLGSLDSLFWEFFYYLMRIRGPELFRPFRA